MTITDWRSKNGSTMSSHPLISIAVLALLSSQSIDPQCGAPARLVAGAAPIELPGLHNVIRVSEKLVSGSSPEGDVGFESLRSLGIKTIITVDGARPEVDRARKFDLRYVHLPIGYDGISQEQANRLARAVRDLPGPIYLHCHHGKHRGPAAAAVAEFCLDAKCTAAAAIQIMKRAGTDPHYTGLIAAPNRIHHPSRDELAAAASDFPESASIPALAQAMVEIDATWDNLQAIRKADSKTPKDQADLDPPHEALQLLERFREFGRRDEIRLRPEEFRKWLSDAEKSAASLEEWLRSKSAPAQLEMAFQRCKASCIQCHAKYRDVPKK
jgi:protein tyrosine phosphatase (PTP) superfamily phosphohydrolase (DUF442 family)